MQTKIQEIQKRLSQQKIDGWLLYDFQQRNDLARYILQIPAELHLTRRFFYWIPAQGKPCLLVHEIESTQFSHLPGDKLIYHSWQSLEKQLAVLLKGVTAVAMEYSPLGKLPYVSKIDAGIVELVRASGVQVVSSAPFLQYFTCVLNAAQLAGHRASAKMLDQIAKQVWELLSSALKNGEKWTEFDVQQWILAEFSKHGFITDSAPHCAVNGHSADPHFSPSKDEKRPIQAGDFILLDLWCKKNVEGAVFADITRVAVAGKPTAKQQQIFSLVLQAQQAALNLIRERFSEREEVKGYEVDQICRAVIEKAGFGAFFPHRTGHNLFEQVHGPGAHLDSLETWDERPLIAGSCFTIEPGIYLPGEFGVRLESDVYITKDGAIEVSDAMQKEIISLEID